MNNIEKSLLELIANEDNLILEFANIAPRDHRFGVEVNLHVMQPGDKQLEHEPRIKVYTGSWQSGPNFTITLEENPRVIGDSSNVVDGKQLKILVQNVKKYRSAFISFWNDSGMTTAELKDLMDKIN